MTPVHALAIFALATLLGERARLVGWASFLKPYERSGAAPLSASDWVRLAFDRSVGMLRARPSLEERRDAVDQVRSAMERDLARRWQRPRDLAFFILVAGCILSLLNLRLIPNAIRWGEIGMPLVLAVFESAAVVLLATWVARDVRSDLSRWQVIANTLSARHQPEGEANEVDTIRETDRQTYDRRDNQVETHKPFARAPEPEARDRLVARDRKPLRDGEREEGRARPTAQPEAFPPIERKRVTTPPSTPTGGDTTATPLADDRRARRQGDIYT
jgi:hypothetical protein